MIKDSEFTKNVSIITLGTIFAQLLTITSMPIFTRLYTPNEFGIFAIYISISSTIATISTLKFDSAIIIPKKEYESRYLLALSISLSIAITIILIIITIMWLILNTITKAPYIQDSKVWLAVSIVAGTMIAICNAIFTWHNRKSAYFLIAKFRVLQSLVAAAFGIAFGMLKIENGLILSQIISVIILIITLSLSVRNIGLSFRIRHLKSIGLKYRKAAQYTLPASLLDTLTQQLPVILIIGWFSTEAAGQFSMAWRVLALPAAMIGVGLGQVFLQKFSETWPDSQRGRILLTRTWLILLGIGITPTIIIMIFGNYLFIVILGHSWGEAGRIASMLAPMLLVILISSPTSGIYLVLNLRKLQLWFAVTFLVYRTGCLYLGFIYNNIYYGLAAWVLCEIMAIVTYNLIALRKMKSP